MASFNGKPQAMVSAQGENIAFGLPLNDFQFENHRNTIKHVKQFRIALIILGSPR